MCVYTDMPPYQLRAMHQAGSTPVPRESVAPAASDDPRDPSGNWSRSPCWRATRSQGWLGCLRCGRGACDARPVVCSWRSVAKLRVLRGVGAGTWRPALQSLRESCGQKWKLCVWEVGRCGPQEARQVPGGGTEHTAQASCPSQSQPSLHSQETLDSATMPGSQRVPPAAAQMPSLHIAMAMLSPEGWRGGG